MASGHRHDGRSWALGGRRAVRLEPDDLSVVALMQKRADDRRQPVSDAVAKRLPSIATALDR